MRPQYIVIRLKNIVIAKKHFFVKGNICLLHNHNDKEIFENILNEEEFDPEDYADKNILKAYNYEKPKNLFLIRANVEQICDVFDTCDNISRIYINFCNPWPKKKHNKKRLTHPRQLESYKSFLVNKGEIYFKTDSDELFEASKEYLKECSFSIISETYDLHNDDIFGNNIETEHEKMFSEEGIKIKALIAVYYKDN